MKIESKDKRIHEILVSGFFRIPRFQRPYSWTKDNTEEFWHDTVENQDKEYFIGSLVVFKSGDVFGIVDGQQRLTTITMLLCAIRDIANSLAEEENGQSATDLKESTHTLIQRKNLKNKQQFVLQTETSYPYFQNHIQSLEKKDENLIAGDEEKLVEDAFLLLRSKLQEMCGLAAREVTGVRRQLKSRIKALETVRSRILDLNAIFIELDNEEDAYEIFETLNTRGKDLSLTDLVKNHVTRHLPEEADGYDRGKERWNKMVKALEDAEINVDTFIHHFWLSQYDYVTAKKLFKSLKKRIRRSDTAGFLRSLEIDAENYRLVMSPSYEGNRWSRQDSEIRDALKAIETFQIRQPMPMLLAVMRLYRKKAITRSQAQTALRLVENHHFSFSAVTSQRSSGGASLRYAKYAVRFSGVSGKNETSQIIKELASTLRAKQVSQSEFEASFCEIKFSEDYVKQKKLVQYILQKFDKHQNHKGPPVKYEEMTVEHLESQSSKRARKTDIARIGNLFLASEKLNDQLGSKPFPAKKKILLNHNNPTYLGSVFENADKWEREEILDRSKEMAKTALSAIWKV